MNKPSGAPVLLSKVKYKAQTPRWGLFMGLRSTTLRYLVSHVKISLLPRLGRRAAPTRVYRVETYLVGIYDGLCMSAYNVIQNS
jgi:hypothetical protein